MPVASTTASATAAQSFLQKVAILATGNATNAGGLAYLESLVGVGNDYSALIDTVNNFMALDILPHLGLRPPLAREGGGFLRCYA